MCENHMKVGNRIIFIFVSYYFHIIFTFLGPEPGPGPQSGGGPGPGLAPHKGTHMDSVHGRVMYQKLTNSNKRLSF